MLGRSGYHSLKSTVEEHGVQVYCRGGGKYIAGSKSRVSTGEKFFYLNRRVSGHHVNVDFIHDFTMEHKSLPEGGILLVQPHEIDEEMRVPIHTSILSSSFHSVETVL